MLHLTAGDVNAARLRDADLAGRVVAAVDPLHEGPAPAGVSGDAWLRVRADYIVEAGWATPDAALGRLREADDAIASAGREDEVVLWFEHDLHCQLLMIRMLDQLGQVAPRRISLVCVGEHPDVASFRSLGDLSVEHIRELFEARPPVTAEQLDVAAQGWSAFTSPEPGALVELALRDASPFPYLRPALRRWLRQFPATRDALSQTERAVLDGLSSGPRSRHDLFKAVQAREEPPFMTDLIFETWLDALVHGPAALVREVDGAVTITDTGREIEQGRRDAIDARGIDRWLGGVHLVSPPAPARCPVWRWNDGSARMERDR